MADPKDFDVVETLRNGLKIRIRAIRSDDKARFAHAFENLDEDSVYTRLFQAKPKLSAQELKSATEVDFEDVVALVATIQSGKREIIIGGGRYLLIDPKRTPRAAEVAFTVEEDYQGLGIAGCILRHLAQIAREKGVTQLEAEVLSNNQAMLAVFTRSGLAIQRAQEDGVVRLRLAL